MLGIFLTGLVALAANECGDPPANGGDIICDENDQTNAASGIDYEFSGTDTNNYTIKVQDNLAVLTTANSNAGRGLDTSHGGTGNLTIDMSSGSIETQGKGAEGIYGMHKGSGSRNLTIRMSGGTIKTGSGTGQETGRESAGINGETTSGNSGNLTIDMSGGSIETGFGTGADAGLRAYGIDVIKRGRGTSNIALSGGSIHTKQKESRPMASIRTP